MASGALGGPSLCTLPELIRFICSWKSPLGGVRRRPRGGQSVGSQPDPAHGASGPVKDLYFVASEWPCKHSQEVAGKAHAPKATYDPFADFTAPKNRLAVLPCGRRAEPSQQQPLPLPHLATLSWPQQCFYQPMPQEHEHNSSVVSAPFQVRNPPAPGMNIIHSLATGRRRAL